LVNLKVAVLYSGGKDSTLATLRALKAGHEIVALISVAVNGQESWMFHLPNVELTSVQADCMGLPWIRIEVSGRKEAEVEEMQAALQPIKERLNVDALCSGAIASNYQKVRVRRVCDSLGCQELSPLWGISEESLLNELLSLRFEIYFTSVSAEGLGRDWLGIRLDEARVRTLLKMKERYRINASGEGGEYETFVCDCPIFRKKIVITDGEIYWKRNSGIWSIKRFSVVGKGPSSL
jgi:diphthine-ammonia ligase